ncbi:hypothetical protein [Frondihabitans sucicola]|uniref:hypothetical protein n=1 Tax=Frondihabitans sucicola TaxID=1268041 RepID=UPI002572AA91|nr:hypothetical protein [Frondihabitans sucicola]
MTPPPGSDMLVAGGDVSVGDATTLDVGHGIGGNVVAGGTAAPLDRITTSGGSVASDAADPLGAFSGFGSVIAQRSASTRHCR